MCENKNVFKDLFDPVKANNNEMDPAIKKTILKYCGDFLGGIWKEVNSEKIDIEKLDGGTLNIILLFSLNTSFHPINNEPAKVVFRVYCKPDSGIISETVICSILAEKNLGPKLYGIFDGGRIEEYIPSKPLTMKDICVPSVSKEIAKQFAQIHQLCIPIKKNANFMDFIDEWFQNLSNNQNLPPFFNIPEHYHKYSPKTLTIQDVKTEIEFIRSKLSKLLKNIVFCHNDLHGGNILLINDNNPKHKGCSKNLNQQVSNPKLMLIDFEFASYNPRGFDLGHHFAEYVFDYEAKTPPYSSPTRIPSKKHMFEFIFEYIDFQNPELSKDEKIQRANKLLKGNDLTKCTICTSYSFKVRKTSLSAQEKAKLLLEWETHKIQIRNDRRDYKFRCLLSVNQPSKYCSMIHDGMCKMRTKLPLNNDHRSKKIEDNDRMFCGLNLAIVHQKDGPHNTTTVGFFSPASCNDTTTNSILSQLIYTLSSLER